MEDYQCDLCLKIFTDNANLNRHNKSKKICITRENFMKLKNRLNHLEKEVEEILDENQKLEDKIEKFENKKISIKGDNNNNTTENSNNVTININAFGTENLDNLDIRKLLKTTGLSTEVKLIKDTWFNDKKPENKNVYISNMRSNTVKVYDGQKFIEQPLMSVTKSIREKASDKLYDLIDDEDTVKMTPGQRRKVSNACDIIENDDPLSESNKENKQHLKCMMYNARPKVKLTRKKDRLP